MDFYRRGRAGPSRERRLDRGIESALQFLLASPEFLIRFEIDPPKSRGAFRLIGLTDLALASRLSFFSGAACRTTILTLASQHKLKTRSCSNSSAGCWGNARSKALVAQLRRTEWLHLASQERRAGSRPFPDFDDNLGRR